MRYSRHFKSVLQEREIENSWIEKTCEAPEKIEDQPDGTKHLLRRIPDYGNRWLRVIVNTRDEPHTAITAFFDRRVKGNS